MADRLDVHTVDLEGTQAIDLASIELVVSGGVRYGMMLRRKSAATVTGGEVTQSLTWQPRRFEGIGPTVRPSCCDRWVATGCRWWVCFAARCCLETRTSIASN